MVFASSIRQTVSRGVMYLAIGEEKRPRLWISHSLFLSPLFRPSNGASN